MRTLPSLHLPHKPAAGIVEAEAEAEAVAGAPEPAPATTALPGRPNDVERSMGVDWALPDDTDSDDDAVRPRSATNGVAKDGSNGGRFPALRISQLSSAATTS